MKIFAVDASGSVGGYKKYWAIVRDLFQKLPYQVNWTYIAWGGSKEVHSLAKAQEYLVQYRSEFPNLGSTCPDKIFEAVPKNAVIEDFIFITDGEIGQTEVDLLEKVLRDLKVTFGHITCHIINAREHINLSTVCSFNRYPDVETHIHNTSAETTRIIKTPTSAEFKLLDEIDQITLAGFNTHYDKIYQVLVSLFMGKEGNDAIHTKLVEVKKRLTKQLAEEETSRCKDNLKDLTIENAQYLIDDYYSGGVVADFAAKVDRLVSMASRGLRNEFSTNMFDIHNVRNTTTVQTATWNPTTTEEDDDGDETNSTITKPVFECPILLSESSPVLLITEGDAILHQLPKKQVDNIRRNPLSCIGSKEIQSRIQARILPYVIGADAVKTLQEEGEFLDPYTRKPVVGYIPLDIAHLSMANMNIALLFGDLKILGNLDLFFIALYMIFRNAKSDEQWIRNEDWQAVMSCWEKQLDHRLYHSKTTISLCGLPNYLMHKVPLYQGIWFVLASGVLRFPDDSIRPLRAHVYTAQHLLALHERSVSYGWAPAITEAMLDMIDATYVTLKLLHDCKMLDAMYWEGLVMSLSFPWMEVEVPVNTKKRKHVLEEEGDGNEEKEAVMEVSEGVEEGEHTVAQSTKRIWKLEFGDPNYVYALHPYFEHLNKSLLSKTPFTREHYVVFTSKVNRLLSASAIPIDLKEIGKAVKNIPPLDHPAHPKTYFWYRPSPTFISETDRAMGYTAWCRVKICPHTCRPYAEETLSVNRSNQPIDQEVVYPWKDAMEIKFQTNFQETHHPYLSMNEWFGRYVMEYDAYPTAMEYWHYVQSRKFKNIKPMPTNFEALWKDLMIDYDEILMCIQPTEFARRFSASTTMVNRKLMETHGSDVSLESVLAITQLSGMVGTS